LKEFIGLIPTSAPFKLLSTYHIAAMSIILGINLLVILFRKNLQAENINKFFRYFMAIILLLDEILLQIWHISIGDWSLTVTLPLHLCGVAVFLCIIMLFTKSFSIYEVAYFWGLAGALQAILTPDLTIYNFPHFRFLQFFLSHGLIITSVIFMTFVHDYRPTLKSIFKTFKITNLYLAFIIFFNLLTGANYLFICKKPATVSLLSYLGPWPWYILSLELVAMLFFIVFYLPFIINDFINKKQSEKDKESFSL